VRHESSDGDGNQKEFHCTMTIQCERLSDFSLPSVSNPAENSQYPLLVGEISGCSTSIHIIRSTESFLTYKNVASVLLIYEGRGSIDIGGNSLQITEVTVFVPSFESTFQLSSNDGEELRVLYLKWTLNDEDLVELATYDSSLPFFMEYSKATTYKEAIKSPKTTSRTLVPKNVIPRFAMGSVHAHGPEEVKRHSHPMLEQLFFGLSSSSQLVLADDESCLLESNDLLHIPLGSYHGVVAEDLKLLHYIWIDMFRDKAGLEWLNTHIEDKK
jgi:mannose-6-phosphate isomerase-like protein (cupin superfamily)